MQVAAPPTACAWSQAHSLETLERWTTRVAVRRQLPAWKTAACTTVRREAVDAVDARWMRCSANAEEEAVALGWFMWDTKREVLSAHCA